ncbi:MAG: dioxygenase [Alphaproteobacteria bacterium]|nr:dioxygenase [Alphaproteobacteria bacterium]
MAALPTLFLSHGSPMTAIEPSATHDFLKGLGSAIPRPTAILCISAHWETARPRLTGSLKPELIYDFHGFPKELYQLRYPAPGSLQLVGRAATALANKGFACDIDPSRGLDHGTWDPLYLAYPAADIPVVQLSIQPAATTDHHLAVGRALRPLRDEGILIVGSGNATHNLRAWRGATAPTPEWVTRFSTWLDDRVLAGDGGVLCRYRTEAPFAVENHPTEDHYLPLLVALGAAGDGARATKIHAGYDGVLDMASYQFA